MEKRRLGLSELEVAPLAFGGNVFGWTADESMSFKLLNQFVDNGFNLIDTADIYSRWHPGNEGGESEVIIGKWLRETGKRDAVIIATKCGMEMGPDKKGLSRKYITQAVDDSLRRMRVDHIDLYQSHEDDLNTPLEETLQTFSELVQAGKVRAIGASNYKADRFEEALKVSEANKYARYETLQPWYNLYDRARYEDALEPLCVKHKIGVIPYFSLAKGFLTGKYKTESDLAQSVRGGGIKDYLNDRGFRIIKALHEVAREHQSNPARVAIAWLSARPSITAPIASATNLKQLEDLIESTELKLDRESMELLDHESDYLAAERV